MGSNPSVSVCIPSFNGEEFIAQSIQSVLEQMFRDFELVIVDDHSSDKTVAVARSFSDGRIRLLENERNLGMGRNWAKAMSLATGKYVKLLGQDDVLHPECLLRQVEVMEEPLNASAVIALCRRNVINASGQVVRVSDNGHAAGLQNGRRLIRRVARSGTNILGEPAVGLFRRRALPGVHPDPHLDPYVGDLCLWAQLLKQGDAFVDPRCFVSFRISPKAVSARTGWRQAASFRGFVRSVRGRPCFEVSAMDGLRGCLLSLFWCLLRNSFMNYHFRRARKATERSARSAGGSGFPSTVEVGNPEGSSIIARKSVAGIQIGTG